MRRAFVSLGSNLGDRAAHLRAGATIVAHADEFRLSSVYETEPWGGVEQEPFWNLVIELVTDASPRELLERCRTAEAAEGRTREIVWGPRTLDADVLLVGDLHSDDPEITVPHPRMWERRFVLVPLTELAPELVPSAAMHAATGDVERIGTLDTLR